MRVGVGHQFIGALGRRIERHRLIDRVGGGIRQTVIQAIHRAARGEHQVRRSMGTAGFQHVEEAHQVALRINVRIVDGITHAGLGRQVDDLLECVLCKQVQQRLLVGHIQPLEAKVAAFGQLRQACLFQLDAVVAVEVVDANDLMAIAAQPLGGMKPDEPCDAGDQYSHTRLKTVICIHYPDGWPGFSGACTGLYQK